MSTNSPISYQPTIGLSYNPNEEKYWDEKLLNQEIERTFEVCHGCRMCFKFCDSFPDLFKFIDQNHNGDVSKVTESETKTVMDSCFQCKLCEVQCPYTPRDNHPYQLDFPKLVHRYQAIRAKKTKKFSLRTMFLKNPDFSGKLARSSLGMVNVMNRVQIHRYFFEKIVGIHRKKLLPDFALKTFESWAKKRGLIKKKVGAEAVLFQTCYVQNNEPQIGKDTIEVLEKNKVDCNCVSGLKCCGMPAWESGDLETLRANAKHNIQKLLPLVEKGAKVLAVNPTCAMMMKKEYAELMAPEDKADAQKVAENVFDPSEYLWKLKEAGRLNINFKSKPSEKVSYHAPCHLRAQAVGFKGRDLIKKIPGVSVGFVAECCGHDGTYAMKEESFEKSLRIGQKAFDGMNAQAAEIWATDCPLAAIQFKQKTGIKPMHPMSILAKAYEENGFAK
jgi:Fe-S oxidoreductase